MQAMKVAENLQDRRTYRRTHNDQARPPGESVLTAFSRALRKTDPADRIKSFILILIGTTVATGGIVVGGSLGMGAATLGGTLFGAGTMLLHVRVQDAYPKPPAAPRGVSVAKVREEADDDKEQDFVGPEGPGIDPERSSNGGEGDENQRTVASTLTTPGCMT